MQDKTQLKKGLRDIQTCKCDGANGTRATNECESQISGLWSIQVHVTPAGLNPQHERVTLQERVSLESTIADEERSHKELGTKWHANKEELKKSLPSLTNYLVNYKPL